jgi:hypothetical protein
MQDKRQLQACAGTPMLLNDLRVWKRSSNS